MDLSTTSKGVPDSINTEAGTVSYAEYVKKKEGDNKEGEKKKE